ncbi:hypothetical protein, partial [Streptomyces bobili]|uniref:hypothetical protein n=1 Tax=Streptomyces bobili TaxID=67280 RepID=UPI001AC0040E
MPEVQPVQREVTETTPGTGHADHAQLLQFTQRLGQTLGDQSQALRLQIGNPAALHRHPAAAHRHSATAHRHPVDAHSPSPCSRSTA